MILYVFFSQVSGMVGFFGEINGDGKGVWAQPGNKLGLVSLTDSIDYTTA